MYLSLPSLSCIIVWAYLIFFLQEIFGQIEMSSLSPSRNVFIMSGLLVLILLVRHVYSEDDLYRILGISHMATSQEVRAAYKGLAKHWWVRIHWSLQLNMFSHYQWIWYHFITSIREGNNLKLSEPAIIQYVGNLLYLLLHVRWKCCEGVSIY